MLTGPLPREDRLIIWSFCYRKCCSSLRNWRLYGAVICWEGVERTELFYLLPHPLPSALVTPQGSTGWGAGGPGPQGNGGGSVFHSSLQISGIIKM